MVCIKMDIYPYSFAGIGVIVGSIVGLLCF